MKKYNEKKYYDKIFCYGILIRLVLTLSIIFNIGLIMGEIIVQVKQNEDVNRDGKVDAKDLLEVQKYIIERE